MVVAAGSGTRKYPRLSLSGVGAIWLVAGGTPIRRSTPDVRHRLPRGGFGALIWGSREPSGTFRRAWACDWRRGSSVRWRYWPSSPLIPPGGHHSDRRSGLAVSTLGVLGVGLTLFCADRRRRCAARLSWWLWFALVCLLTAAALSSGNVRTAVVGTPERHSSGCSPGCCCGVHSWLVSDSGPMKRRLVQVGMAVGAALLGVWSLLELLLGEALIPIATDTQRLTGPFGSAAYLGAAVCLFVPVAVGVAVQVVDASMGTRRRSRWRFDRDGFVARLREPGGLVRHRLRSARRWGLRAAPAAIPATARVGRPGSAGRRVRVRCPAFG